MSTEFIYTRVLITLPAFSLGTIFSSSYIVKIEIKAKQKGNVRLKTAGVCKYIRAYFIFFKMPNSISLHFTTTTQIGLLRKNINKIGLYKSFCDMPAFKHDKKSIFVA